MTDSLITTTSSDPFTRGLNYLSAVQSLAMNSDMIQIGNDVRVPVCTWIGQNIERVNAQLNTHLQACHQCFHPWEQPPVRIFAAPLDQSFGLDAICNFQTRPFTLLIDVGRANPKDWLLLVVHEYAHAHAGSPGHHSQFARSLTHLCLGLGIDPPHSGMEDRLRFYPHYVPTQDPLRFWSGESRDLT